jgi:putative peptidoglycan lipid II flippase
MSEPAIPLTFSTAPPQAARAVSKSFLGHAKLIGFFTLISRVLGLAREVVAGHYLGTGVVAVAFTVAFTIPNLFRKLLGEGALASAFIPLYAQAVRRGQTESGEPASDFAAASVNLRTLILAGITIIGEAIIFIAVAMSDPIHNADRLLMLKFAAVMLPYVMLVCGGAFLSAILQVHQRFGPPAFAPVLLNVCHIAVVFGGAWFLGLHGKDAQTPRVVALQARLAYALAVTVLIAGMLQVGILMPALREVGFRFRASAKIWTPAIKKMLLLSLPVAMGAGVLQISVLLDKGISYSLMQGEDRSGAHITHFEFFGHRVRYPMEMGATRRLDLAQLLYQFPLGVFAIALATAIFPNLSAGALDQDREHFRAVLRHGIEATLWEGLPASVGLILVAEPAARLLFQHGQISGHDATLIARSTQLYAGAIWAFSLLQIVNRAYYAVHDAVTPLIMSIVNIALNLIFEIPLLWWLGESAMAVGTLISFVIQAIVMVLMLDRRIGGLGLRRMLMPTIKMLLATLTMVAMLLALRSSRVYPHGAGRGTWMIQLIIMLAAGAATYLGACAALGVDMLQSLLPRRRRRGAAS